MTSKATPKVDENVERVDLQCRRTRSTLGARRAPSVDLQSRQTPGTRRLALWTNALHNGREEGTKVDFQSQQTRRMRRLALSTNVLQGGGAHTQKSTPQVDQRGTKRRPSKSTNAVSKVDSRSRQTLLQKSTLKIDERRQMRHQTWTLQVDEPLIKNRLSKLTKVHQPGIKRRLSKLTKGEASKVQLQVDLSRRTRPKNSTLQVNTQGIKSGLSESTNALQNGGEEGPISPLAIGICAMLPPLHHAPRYE